MKQIPFYNPEISYQENYDLGPFGEFSTNEVIQKTGEPQHDFLGHKVFTPFGIPAGPLANANFVAGAFRKGFDICVYKTVRTREYPCHPWPNVLAIHEEKLEAEKKEPLVADAEYTTPLSITNSFGVPSTTPEIWQADMEKALKAAGKGQVMIGSFQGTSDGSGNVDTYIKDSTLPPSNTICASLSLSFISPITSKSVVGAEVPIPTWPSESTIKLVPVEEPTTNAVFPAVLFTERIPNGVVVPIPTLPLDAI